jgi:hypothetical protein
MASIQCNRTSPIDDSGGDGDGVAESTVFYGIILCLIAAFVLAFSMNVRRCDPA